MIDRRQTLAALGSAVAAAAAGAARAQDPVPPPRGTRPDPTEVLELWPGGAPGAPATLPVERIEERSKDPARSDRAVTGTHRPRLAVFRPTRPNGSALLVAPGGGYVRTVVDKEGYEIGHWLAERGWTVFVLFYRLPGDGWTAGPDTPLQDSQRAMRLIRSRAQSYGIRADRVAAMGFSAGGHVCGDLATRYDARVYAPMDAADRLSARPDLAAPIYAVQSMQLPVAHAGSRTQLLGANPTAALEAAHTPASNVRATTPPCFLVHAEDDAVVGVDNTLAMRAALKRAGVAVQTHLFAEGGHGFGIRGAAGKPAAAWPELFARWAQTYGFG